MKIDQETLAVFDRCIIAADTVKLPLGQLERPLYMKVNKVLAAAGGKWSRKAQAHVFDADVVDILEQAMLTGEIGNPKQELGVFYTPPELAFKAAQALRIDPAVTTVLEPSAGMGGLALACREAGSSPICFDILKRHVDALRNLGFTAAQIDFLKLEPVGVLYDRIIMNPPFAKQDDARHFLHAIRFLKPGGRIVAIMSVAVTFRMSRPYSLIRALVADNGGSIEPLPSESFKESGTMVNTALVIYDKPNS